MNSEKEILFLSPFDFVEKGIQVILKTPLFYAENDWKVHFIVIRDSAKDGSYYYEKKINPPSIQTYRYDMYESSFISNLCKNKISKTIYTKIRNYVSVFQLIYHGIRILNKNEKIKVLYGYGPVGTLAAYFLKLLFLKRSLKVVSRYFGITGTDSLLASVFKRILNWDVLLSLVLPVEACIITNDGTEGDKLLEKFFPKRLQRLHFWVNGVEEKPAVNEEDCARVINKYSLEGKTLVLSVSRLAYWKRVDRSIQVIHEMVKKDPSTQVKLLVLGDGADKERLVQLTNELGLSDYVLFVGAISNKELGTFYNIAHFFISTYDLSNVGNPLLEAIRYNKVIFTLNNGDTSRWIKHKENGYIYNIDDTLIEKMAKDLYDVSTDDVSKNLIIEKIKETEKRMLWTWDERLMAELNLVNSIVGIR